MILWLTIVQVVVAVAAGLFCLIAGLAGRRPSDGTVGSLVLIELLLIAQVVVAIVAPFVGNPPVGSALESGSIWCPRCFCPRPGWRGRSWSVVAGAP